MELLELANIVIFHMDNVDDNYFFEKYLKKKCCNLIESQKRIYNNWNVARKWYVEILIHTCLKIFVRVIYGESNFTYDAS